MNYKVVSQLYQPIFLSFSYLNSAQHNLVIELCCALKRLFSKLTYIYVPIELLDCSKMQNSIFIVQEIFRHLGLKTNSLRKKDQFFLSMYIRHLAKNCLLCINVSINDSRWTNLTYRFIYTKSRKQLRNCYIYIQIAKHLTKSKTI